MRSIRPKIDEIMSVSAAKTIGGYGYSRVPLFRGAIRRERSTRERTFVPRSGHLYLNVQNENESESKNATGEDTYAGALRGPRAGSPACVFVFTFVFVLNV